MENGKRPSVRARTLLAVVGTATLAACYSPSYSSDCPFSCVGSSGCPTGYSCALSRNLCCRGGGASDFALERTIAAENRIVVPELLWTCDTDENWRAGQLARARVASGQLQIDFSKGSAAGPSAVTQDGDGRDWCYKPAGCQTSSCWVHDPSPVLQGTHIFSDLSRPSSGQNLSRYLHCTGLGTKLPDPASVDGVTVEISHRPSGTVNQIQDEVVQLIVGGVRSGDNKRVAAFWPGDGAYHAVSYGSPTDRWGLTVDAAQANGSGFGVALRVKDYYEGENSSAWVASVKLVVSYTNLGAQYTSSSVALPSPLTRWSSLEVKEDAEAACGSNAILYDVLKESGEAVRKDARPVSGRIDLSDVAEAKLAIRVRLRTATTSCNPAVDFLKLYGVR